jgi:hypothetical protein
MVFKLFMSSDSLFYKFISMLFNPGKNKNILYKHLENVFFQSNKKYFVKLYKIYNKLLIVVTNRFFLFVKLNY